MSLPPSPGHLRDVEVDFCFYNRSADQWLDDVGERCIARHLVKLPSGFLECGPSFPGAKLRHPLHLRNIIVTLVRVSARPPRDNDENPSWRLVGHYQSIAYARLAVFLSNVQDSGLLFETADMLKLRCDGMDDKEWEVTAREDIIRTANLWAKYG